MGEDKGVGGIVFDSFRKSVHKNHKIIVKELFFRGWQYLSFSFLHTASDSLHIMINMISFAHISEFFRTIRPNSLCKYLP